ncbi:Rha family transcriptional regulator [Stenotrophomonas maltophilia]|uniref:Rha family transcriptional regulator n=1 Tax=Stenotrophomonas maltophilia TaxID=40324 RepID=UPI001FA6FB58|nr:Rha family transcriptional regulator [Stenotrophomonas maltophilia]HDX0791779.1 Rha family transcriptional regulator [Stenotrophomonas maltophilia]HDX0938427.1 Rha family transcriptional regulator [Stenotrophomonas maltophilia]
MTIPDQLPIPVVRVSPTGGAFTTSTDVATFFDKRHSHVLRAIEGLLSDLREHIQWPEQADVDEQWDDEEHQPKIGLMFPGELFEAAEVEVRLGNGAIRRDPIYNLSRDGFALLAMGFTGRQALAFKLAYISAFNAMEARLREPYVAPLAEDLEFARGLRVKDKIMLHEQAYRASRALTAATNDDERRQAYWQLYQVNTTLGIPTPTREALGVTPLASSNRLLRGPDRSDG